MQSSLPSVLALALLLPAVAQAQSPVNFTGGWTMVPDRSESPQQTPPINSLVFHITHDAAELRVESIRDGVTSTATFPIGPAASPGVRTTGADAGTARAFWNGDRLVTERAGAVQGQTVSITQTFALNGSGSELTVETLLVVQHGYTLRGAKNYGAKTDVFTRTP